MNFDKTCLIRRLFRHKIFKTLCALILLISLGLGARLAVVQSQIKNAPVIITDLSKSGYTPEGVYGHGNLTGPWAGKLWYIYDKPGPDGLVQKVCAKNILPQPEWDIDFIYYEGAWFKLRTGTAEINETSMSVSPDRLKWKGSLQTKTAFPIRRPDVPYRFKILYSKLKQGTLSPLDYVQSLRASNPVCADIPEP